MACWESILVGIPEFARKSADPGGGLFLGEGDRRGYKRPKSYWNYSK